MAEPTGANLFGRTFACSCGRTHRIEPRCVVYGDDAGQRLASLCADLTAGRRAAAVMDARTRAAAGADVAAALADEGWSVCELIVPDPSPERDPVCDEATKGALAARLGKVDLVVAVGSGVISDLGKWLAWEADLPTAVFATAASMNGYASANVAATVQGVKTLLRARPPAIVAAAPAVLIAAPREMTAAGLGDALAKSTSSADWYMNHVLFGDYYCRPSVELIADVEPLYLEHPEGIRRGQGPAMKALFDALLLTGVAMTMAETSSPASGGEHLISHTLDMMSALDGVEHDLHGRQVGVGTVMAAELYRRVLAVESPQLVDAPGQVDADFWGPLAGAVGEQYAQKADRLAAAKQTLSRGGTWDDLRQAVSPLLRRPETIRDCLGRAGAAQGAEDLGCDRQRVLAALLHAHEIRARFTVLDLAGLVGVMPAAAGEIVEAWA
jgi:glycerol-1-phosphate dehydrogenase [NAD(P)+]